MKITDLRVNNVAEPLGFQVTPLSLSWRVTESHDAKRQEWARIRICKDDVCLFDSGEDCNANSLDYPVDFAAEPRTRYRWQVEVAADNGDRASAESWFETGKMNEEWVGKWITPTLDPEISPVMKKTFTVSTTKNARLYLCGLGVYEAYLNGEKIGDEYLAPGYHSYDFHLQAQTYDVTGLLAEGENVLTVWLGDGWFRGRLGFDGGFTDLYGDRCYLIGELYCDQKLLVCTDESWQCKASPVVFSNIYDGEVYDARLETALSDNSGWMPVQLQVPEKCGSLEPEYAEFDHTACRCLCDRYSLPIKAKEKLYPVWLETPKKEKILDFRQNMTGWVEFDCELPEDTAIRLTAAEILQDACFYRDNLRTAKAEFIYTSNGKRAHVRPHFTFYGFRYMKVECLDKEGTVPDTAAEKMISNVVGIHLRSDFDQIGFIKTGDDKVNRLFLNALWGQKDNFLDVPTDCPQRDERLGWTGDAQIFSETASYNMYMPAFYRKYMWDFRAEQSIICGSGPNVVPRLKKGMVAEHGSCPWADAAVVIPWNMYMQYGNRTLLAECYPGMKAWIDCQREKEEAQGGPHLIKDGFHFADWLSLDNPIPGPFGATDPLFIASAYYWQGAARVAEAAEILGYSDDAKEYGDLSEQIRQAIFETYFDDEGKGKCETQTASAMAIVFGIIPPQAGGIQKEADALKKRIDDNDGHLNTGFVGTPNLCPALTKGGYHQTAVDLLLNEEYPGWLYCVNLGATTIWERWNSVEPDGHLNADGMNSLNHYSYGSIEAWMYKDVCGIRPASAGYKKAVIAPHADERLGFVDGVLETSAGTYRSSWKVNDDHTVTYNIEIPFDAEAEFILGSEKMTLQAGTYSFTI